MEQSPAWEADDRSAAQECWLACSEETAFGSVMGQIIHSNPLYFIS